MDIYNNIIQSENGNCYYYNEDSKEIGLIHPMMLNSLQNNNDIDDYYYRKHEFLKEKLNQFPQTSSFFEIDAEVIKSAMANTRQLIFEVTENCNLNCKYCAYGDLYNNYNKRINKKMSFDVFLSIIDFMKTLWNSTYNLYAEQTIHISFYGGEPLLNFDFIKKAVTYLSDNPIPRKNIIFSMTTNGYLLDKYQEFLVENDFQLLISLDGNAYHNSYRVDKKGNSSFEKIISNLDRIKDKYPLFFKNNINFNSVLHNRNSVEDTSVFIFEKFGKYAQINELNTSGIAPDKADSFYNMFKSKKRDYKNIKSVKNCSYLTLKENPIYREGIKFLNQTTVKNYNKNFNSVLQEGASNESIILQTGTCIPFSRKVFVTAGNKLLPCERIGNLFDFGKIENNEVVVDFTSISNYMNSILSGYKEKCMICVRKLNCPLCIFDFPEGNKECYKYNKDYLMFYLKEIFTYLENNPKHYYNMTNKTILI